MGFSMAEMSPTQSEVKSSRRRPWRRKEMSTVKSGDVLGEE